MKIFHLQYFKNRKHLSGNIFLFFNRRGQLYNLAEVLLNVQQDIQQSPVMLYEKPLLYVHETSSTIEQTLDKINEIKDRIQVLGRLAIFKSC
jgi:hypothetical protein